MNNDIFNLDNVFDEKEGNDLTIVIGVIIRGILALTTFGFFFLFAGNLFNWLVGSVYSPWLAGVIGTFSIDGLAYIWDRLRKYNSTTISQITIAKILTIVNGSLSALVPQLSNFEG